MVAVITPWVEVKQEGMLEGTRDGLLVLSGMVATLMGVVLMLIDLRRGQQLALHSCPAGPGPYLLQML